MENFLIDYQQLWKNGMGLHETQFEEISKIIFKAYRDEPQEFVKHLDDFGLTEPLGIDLIGPVP